MSDDQTLNILIADDEAPARNRLRALLDEIPETRVVAEAANGKEALALAASTLPHVMLLDIRMPEMDGIEAAEHSLKLHHPPAVIFTTAFDAHAMQAFDMSAVDYLLKPIRRERLFIALKKARALLPTQFGGIKQLHPQRTHFSISERGRILLIPVHDVIYLRAELKYLTVRTREREYLIEDSLINIEKEFSDLFIRLHRNCLVAQSAIRGFERRHNEDGESHWVALLKELPETLPVSRRQQHIVHEMGG